MKKARVLGILLILIILSISVVVFATGKDTTELDRSVMVANNAGLKISLNKVPLNIPSEYGKPFIDNQSRTMIPLRIVSERLGHKVEWEHSTQTATIDGQISIKIGERVVKTPNGDISMDTFAILKDGRTYVPLRFVAEALDYEVSYDGPNYSNNYQHMVDISGETPTQEPIGEIEDSAFEKNGNVYTIKTEMGDIELDLDTDVNKYREVEDEKAYELMRPIHRSVKLEEGERYVKINFHLPEMPKEDGISYGASIDLVTKDGRYLGIWDTSGPGTWGTDLGNGYHQVELDTSILDITMSDVEYITLGSQVMNGNTASNTYRSELRTGAEAFGQNEFLFEKVREIRGY